MHKPTYHEAHRAWQREKERARGTRTCSACGAPIVWLRITKRDKTLGKPQPFDHAWTYGDGRKHLAVPTETHGRVTWHLLARAPRDVRGREPHHGTCPHAARYRQDASSREAATPTQTVFQPSLFDA